jgi:hypothetical protein
MKRKINDAEKDLQTRYTLEKVQKYQKGHTKVKLFFSRFLSFPKLFSIKIFYLQRRLNKTI